MVCVNIMAFTDASLVALRVFREVAERGTLTAAAAALGYTQSAVSRQIAALERAAGTPLLERRHDGVRLTPAGRIVLRRAAAVVDQVDATARELAGLERVVLICGLYEGVDERVNALFCDREISIGDYVLSGGELAAAVVLDATMRLLPGVLGNDASSENESFGPADALRQSTAGAGLNSTHGAGGLLDYPHYTRPAEFRGVAVPEVLSSGNHEQIRRWRREQALKKTLRNRPDLLRDAELSAEDRSFLRALELGAESAQAKDSV